MEKIGLIAGSDELPLVFARGAAEDGKHVVVAAFRGHTSPEIEKLADTRWLDSVNPAKILEIFTNAGVRRLAMEGKLPHSIVLSGGSEAIEAASLMEGAPDLQTQSILGRAAGFLEALGIEVMDARTYLEPVLFPDGVLTEREPDGRENADISFGAAVLKKIGAADIGQAVVVKNRVVLAVEAIEGTDAAIKRGAELGGAGVVVVKTAKPGQDMRFDLPVVGEGTIRTMADCGASALAAEAANTVLLNRESVFEKARAAGITISGFYPWKR